jgi:hypothetical protein
MGKKVYERVIPQAEYCVRLEQRIPVGDCWVDMGNGVLAYAFQKMLTIDFIISRYGERSFALVDVCALYCPEQSKHGNIYRYDDKTGDMILFKESDDEFDKIGKFKYDKEKDEWVLKTTRKGKAKTYMDNIEKGILSDGMNFKTQNNIIAVEDEGLPSVEGVESFILNLSDMVGREIGGAYFSKDGKGTTHISIGMYKQNTYTETKGHGHTLWNKMYPDLKIENNITGFFHTHPSGGTISVSDRTNASTQDKESKASALKQIPTLQFFILTHPVYYGGTNKFPY